MKSSGAAVRVRRYTHTRQPYVSSKQPYGNRADAAPQITPPGLCVSRRSKRTPFRHFGVCSLTQADDQRHARTPIALTLPRRRITVRQALV